MAESFAESVNRDFRDIVNRRLDQLEGELKSHQKDIGERFYELNDNIHRLRQEINKSVSDLEINMKLMQIEKLTDDVKRAESSKTTEASKSTELATIKTKSELLYTIFVGAIAAIVTTMIATAIKYLIGV